MHLLKKTLSVLLLSVTLVPARAERVLFAHYTVDDGLASNTVNSLCQDDKDFVWLATRYGISRFDGVNFKNFNTSTDTVILKNDVGYAFILTTPVHGTI
ncbi:MAG: hypothetical protein J5875_04740 [Paludibacteraceae bacterium]|nr:hypothetical protein [Paludibacteraceae bacterium]